MPLLWRTPALDRLTGAAFRPMGRDLGAGRHLLLPADAQLRVLDSLNRPRARAAAEIQSGPVDQPAMAGKRSMMPGETPSIGRLAAIFVRC